MGACCLPALCVHVCTMYMNYCLGIVCWRVLVVAANNCSVGCLYMSPLEWTPPLFSFCSPVLSRFVLPCHCQLSHPNVLQHIRGGVLQFLLVSISSLLASFDAWLSANREFPIYETCRGIRDINTAALSNSVSKISLYILSLWVHCPRLYWAVIINRGEQTPTVNSFFTLFLPSHLCACVACDINMHVYTLVSPYLPSWCWIRDPPL